jgi:hypothetical protein
MGPVALLVRQDPTRRTARPVEAAQLDVAPLLLGDVAAPAGATASVDADGDAGTAARGPGLANEPT